MIILLILTVIIVGHVDTNVASSAGSCRLDILHIGLEWATMFTSARVLRDFFVQRPEQTSTLHVPCVASVSFPEIER